MTSFVITARGEIYTDGVLLPDGACRGCAAPAEITGTGEFFIVCNPMPDVQDGFVDISVTDEDGTERTETVAVFKPAPPVSITLTDALGEVITVPQNTRFPQMGYFDLSGSTVRVE